MKKTLLTIAIAIAAQFAFGQNQFSAYGEATNQGQKSGIMAGKVFTIENEYYKTSYDIAVGGFYQHQVGAQSVNGESATELTGEREFYGAYTEFMFNTSRKISIAFNIRTGVQNGENFVIAPMLKTGVKVSAKAKFEVGLSTRNIVAPTATYGLTFRF